MSEEEFRKQLRAHGIADEEIESLLREHREDEREFGMELPLEAYAARASRAVTYGQEDGHWVETGR